MRARFVLAHRWLSLGVATIWMLQALSGAYLVFHRAIDDASLGAAGHAARPAAVERALAGARASGGRVLQYFVSGGVRGQVDLLVDQADGKRQVVRIDGATGQTLRVSAWERPRLQVAPSRLVLLVHKSLLAGPAGTWIIGLSGVLLVTNLVLGLRLGWPARGRWRTALIPGRARSAAGLTHAWHRAAGLWLAPFALAMALTGIGLAWIGPLETAAGAATAFPPACQAPGGEAFIGLPAAERTALRVFPGATVAVVTLPTAARPCYAVQLRRPGEWRRVFGNSMVYVDARDGAALAQRDMLAAAVPARMVEAIYPVHTGEWAGIGGRVLVILVGLWLAATAGLGLSLWWVRRRARAR